MSKNNGGSTSYYDIPLPYRGILRDILIKFTNGENIEDIIDNIYEVFPKTLNDLIEYKEMLFWRGEVFKAVYALEERAVRSSDNASIRRELNKILYYTERAIAKENINAITK
jgi:hypothetical protein